MDTTKQAAEAERTRPPRYRGRIFTRQRKVSTRKKQGQNKDKTMNDRIDKAIFWGCIALSVYNAALCLYVAIRF